MRKLNCRTLNLDFESKEAPAGINREFKNSDIAIYKMVPKLHYLYCPEQICYCHL